jgi:hypothetical protein
VLLAFLVCPPVSVTTTAPADLSISGVWLSILRPPRKLGPLPASVPAQCRVRRPGSHSAFSSEIFVTAAARSHKQARFGRRFMSTRSWLPFLVSRTSVLDFYICLPSLVLHLPRTIVTSDHHTLTMRYFHCIYLPHLFPIQQWYNIITTFDGLLWASSSPDQIRIQFVGGSEHKRIIA